MLKILNKLNFPIHCSNNINKNINFATEYKKIMRNH